MTHATITLLAVDAEPTELDAHAYALKNCVTVIIGLAASIQHHVTPIARRRATELLKASECLKDLLTVPARRADGPRVHREILRIDDVLQVVSERLAPEAEGSAVQLAIDSSDETMAGDFGGLVEALYNLASNAIKASMPGDTVHVATRRNQDGDHEWSVRDSGAGIPGSLMPRLGMAGVTTCPSGMGLGLALALQVVQRHHGVMRIESAEGNGTTVKMWLPGAGARTRG